MYVFSYVSFEKEELRLLTESASSSSSEDEEEEEGPVSSSELSSNKGTLSQEGLFMLSCGDFKNG